MQMDLFALEDFPEISPRDDVAQKIVDYSKAWSIADNDIVVIAQKIISKAENRLINLEDIVPSDKAIAYSHNVQKDPRIIQLILDESKKVIRTRTNLMIVQHKLGFICANAGIDQSNVKQNKENVGVFVLLLPKNPDESAREIQRKIFEITGARVGVLIIDSHGRPWRKGVVGISIGMAGVPGVEDQRGKADRYGYILKGTEIGAADELAASASILMGQSNEGRPVVWVRGFPYPLRKSSLSEIIREDHEDLFR